MQEELDLVRRFHEKFHVPILERASLIPTQRYELRHKLMADEVREYLDGCAASDLPNIALELADVLFAVYGTILEHGLQDKMPAVFRAVYESNMSKTYSPAKMLKGPEYFKADPVVRQIVSE